MQLLAWSEEFATGVEAIDAEHHAWMDRINRLMVEHGPDDAGVHGHRFFKRLRGALERQFKREEQLMRDCGPAGFEDHMRDHARLIDEIRELDDVFGEAEEIDVVELSLRLDAWFARHFRTHDAALYGRLSGNG